MAAIDVGFDDPHDRIGRAVRADHGGAWAFESERILGRVDAEECGQTGIGGVDLDPGYARGNRRGVIDRVLGGPGKEHVTGAVPALKVRRSRARLGLVTLRVAL